MAIAWSARTTLCSRNDVVANGGVLLAALGVALTGSTWPDIVVGLSIAALFARYMVGVIGDARRALHPGPTDGSSRRRLQGGIVSYVPKPFNLRYLDHITMVALAPRLGRRRAHK